MGNVLTNLFQTKVQPGLYKQFYIGATSSWMERNAGQVEYHGGKYVYITEMTVDGLGDYDRNLGYPRGSVNGSKVPFEMTKDRGREFLIDAADNDETGFLVTGASVMAEFQRTHVIPEVDSYRYSQIYAQTLVGAAGNIDDTAIAAASITDTLNDDIAEIKDAVGDIPLMIIMSGLTRKYFGREFERLLSLTDLLQGNIKTQVLNIDGNPLITVPSARLKTAYTYSDGVSAGQEAGGFAAAGGAKDMKWMIIPSNGPMALGKIDKMRAFSPDEYQSANAWKVDYRLYHDLWMTKNAYNNTRIRTGSITTS